MTYLHAAEAAELAIEVGEVGQACYRLMAERTRYPRIRALLLEMVQEEQAHCAVWEALCDSQVDARIQSEEEWQEYRQYVRAAARSILPYAPERILATAEQAHSEGDVIGIAKELAERIARFAATLCGTASLNGCKSMAERIVMDKESRLRDLSSMLWSTPPEQRRSAARSRAVLGVALSAQERELSPIAERVAGD
jgi:rubrerythrin